MDRSKTTKGILISLLITLVVGAVYWYVFLPPLNIKSFHFITYVGILVAIFFICSSFSTIVAEKTIRLGASRYVVPFYLVLVGLYFVLSFVSAPFFHAKQYAELIDVEKKDFATDFKQIQSSQIPIIDKDTAVRLGSRKFGEVVELVSQFSINQDFNQINFQNQPVRVGYLEYADWIKWFTNQKEGIPYFIQANMANQNVSLVKLKENMMYSPSEYLNRNLLRHVRFLFPGKITSDPFFEIDDDSRPYWIIPVVQYDILFNGAEDIQGAILMDAASGAATYYPKNEVPTWVDNVYPSWMLLDFASYWGKYKDGWLNATLGQKNVVKTTDGYNYLAIDDDVWLYTGITSATSDESNIGFILMNKRTKETKLYNVNGAEEFSAMESAQGKVQEKNYRSTFPILLNIGDKPTYFVALKDSAGLVKLYAYISVEDYQIVGIGDNPDDAQRSYILALNNSGNTLFNGDQKVEGTITEILTAIADGNTMYYIQLDHGTMYYLASIKVSEQMPLLKIGDHVQLSFFDNGDSANLKVVNSISRD